MAYSRFSNGCIWYTFWSSNGVNNQFKWPTKELKDAQVFEICDFPSFRFTYGDLDKKGISPIIAKIKKFYNKPHKGSTLSSIIDGKWNYEDTIYPAKKPSEEQLRELIEYISEWRKDIDEHFQFRTFIKYEWYYPLKNILRRKLHKIKFK
jgi:hypothetical protein